MEAAAALVRLGGTADARSLLRLATRRSVRRALRERRIVRLARGRYTMPVCADGVRAAQEVSGVLALRSAAMHHGWEVAEVPEHPEVAVPRNRKVTASRRRGRRVIWMTLGDDDREAGVTTPLRTVVDCARRLPFPEALAIADSALRSGMLTVDELRAVGVRGPGADAVRRVTEHADGRAANPFESVLRALALEAGLEVEPQAEVDLGTGVVHPDVVAVLHRLVLEADSWTWHTSRKAHRRDCARYNLLSVRGWTVLRFTWEQVMHDQRYVRWVLAQLPGRVGRAGTCPCPCHHARLDPAA